MNERGCTASKTSQFMISKMSKCFHFALLYLISTFALTEVSLKFRLKMHTALQTDAFKALV